MRFTTSAHYAKNITYFVQIGCSFACAPLIRPALPLPPHHAEFAPGKRPRLPARHHCQTPLAPVHATYRTMIANAMTAWLRISLVLVSIRIEVPGAAPRLCTQITRLGGKGDHLAHSAPHAAFSLLHNQAEGDAPLSTLLYFPVPVQQWLQYPGQAASMRCTGC